MSSPGPKLANSWLLLPWFAAARGPPGSVWQEAGKKDPSTSFPLEEQALPPAHPPLAPHTCRLNGGGPGVRGTFGLNRPPCLSPGLSSILTTVTWRMCPDVQQHLLCFSPPLSAMLTSASTSVPWSKWASIGLHADLVASNKSLELLSLTWKVGAHHLGLRVGEVTDIK